METKGPFSSWRLPLQALAVAALVAVVRVFLDLADAERISVSPLVATIITATVFILGFLLTGVLADYKESEKLPGDMAVALGVIADECVLIWRHKQAEPARDCLRHVADLTTSVRHWFFKTERTVKLREKVEGLGHDFYALEPHTQPNFIVRLKQEQASISRMIMRIHTIRETSFVSSGYIMGRLAAGLVLLGLLLLKVDPWYESAFVVGVIAWFLSYLIMLIDDLDNPFDYGMDGRPKGQEVSLKPLDDLEQRLREEEATLDLATPAAATAQAT